ncbi:MAG: hypothetical protein PHN84_03295 [Desulfuromonadaceae bacterium]|nr:hypothetical protein [Desulfuromonadaceae bacterium]
MALTKRKDILDDIVYRLGQISAITTVAKWRDTDAEPFDSSECPAINIKNRDADITHNVSDDEHALPISLEIHTTSRITADDAESLLGDVAGQVESNSTWGGHADGTTVESHGIDTTQTGDTITAAALEIIVHYTTDKGKI